MTVSTERDCSNQIVAISVDTVIGVVDTVMAIYDSIH